MKNKILIGIVVLLALLVVSVRFMFNSKFEDFKVSVQQYENEQLANFQKEKEKKIAELSNESLAQLFNQYFDESKSIIEKDTTFSFLYLSESVKYKVGRLDYFDCLHQKCIVEKQNETVQQQITLKEKELEKKFGSTFTSWYPKLKDEKLLQKTSRIGNCSGFYSDLYQISYNKDAWSEFEKFMNSYDNEIEKAQIQSKQAETLFLNNVSSTKRSLKSGVINYFDSRLANNNSQILSTESESKTFNSPALGIITYNITKTSFNKQAFQNVADDAFEEQWKYNSLSTGSMPYSSCYGSSNYCSDWSCSKIKVITGGSGDVLVSIKNSYGKVVRHAYIKGGNSFTFNVPDGSYQVFFYSGTGWNPNKQMPSSSCSYLKGGFVSNEDVTKDNYINLYSQIMTYELILQQQGNFSTKPSSKNEAF
ncbi:MAG: hypothetical protein KDE33_07955 [Bacteroidetes bacterium]|nr:hypothetical protein [Bacteroidota bacterium]